MTITACPSCGTADPWHNAEKVATGWRGPLRKCKNTACTWVLWPPKKPVAHNPSTGEVTARAEGPGKPKPSIPGDADAQLGACWTRCFDEVMAATNGRVEDGAVMAGVNSLFIARARLITNG